MSHAVETMAWANTVPWHGLGVKVDDTLSAADMLKAAQLDWTVSLQPMTTGNGIAVDGFSALIRDSDSSVLDVVGNRWLPTQNVEGFEFFNEFVHAGSAKMETAGSLKGGRVVWGLAALNESFTLRGKDRVNGYLLLSLPHEQGKSIQAKFTSIRVVCNNTLTAALRGKGEFRQSHRMVFDAKMQEQAKQSMGIAREQFDEQRDQATLLSNATVSRADELRILAELLDDDLFAEPVHVIVEKVAAGKVNKRMEIAAAALDKAPGQLLESAKGTLWGTLNAITYSVDHAFGRGQDQRLVKAWYGPGATLKQDALELLLKRAA